MRIINRTTVTLRGDLIRLGTLIHMVKKSLISPIVTKKFTMQDGRMSPIREKEGFLGRRA